MNISGMNISNSLYMGASSQNYGGTQTKQLAAKQSEQPKERVNLSIDTKSKAQTLKKPEVAESEKLALRDDPSKVLYNRRGIGKSAYSAQKGIYMDLYL